MRIKPGVCLITAHPALLHMLDIVDAVYRKYDCTLTITSLQDGQHSTNSRHYGIPGDGRGRAADFRTNDVPATKLPAIVADCKRLLGAAFDVVLEGDHLHVEYDPDF